MKRRRSAVDCLVSSDYDLVMTNVGIAELKAHLSRYVRSIRRGETVVVLDRNEPVARMVPFQSEQTILPIRQPLRPLHDFTLPSPVGTPVDSLSALLKERRDRR